MTRRSRAFARLVYGRLGLRCLFNAHQPRRTAIGGFRCASCGLAGGDYEDFALTGGHINPLRKLFDRDRHEITRTAAWEPGRRGY
jgi:hypothetical protein